MTSCLIVFIFDRFVMNGSNIHIIILLRVFFHDFMLLSIQFNLFLVGQKLESWGNYSELSLVNIAGTLPDSNLKQKLQLT